MAEPASPPPGIFSALKRLLSTALAVGQNRLELFLVEFREERLQFFELLILAGIAIVLGTMTLAVITVTIVAVCLRANRIDLVLALILLYALLTFIAFWQLRKRLQRWEPFSATLTELKKDKACLAEKN